MMYIVRGYSSSSVSSSWLVRLIAAARPRSKNFINAVNQAFFTQSTIFFYRVRIRLAVRTGLILKAFFRDSESSLYHAAGGRTAVTP